MSQHPRQGQTKEHREGLCGPSKQTHFPKALSRTTHPSTSSISLGLDCHWGWRGKVVPSQEESQRRQERCHSLGRGAPTTSGRTHAPGTGAKLRARTCWRRHGSELPAAAIGRRPPQPEGAGRGPPEPRPLSPTAGAQPRWDTPLPRESPRAPSPVTASSCAWLFPVPPAKRTRRGRVRAGRRVGKPGRGNFGLEPQPSLRLASAAARHPLPPPPPPPPPPPLQQIS